MDWNEKYKPKTINELITNKKAVSSIIAGFLINPLEAIIPTIAEIINEIVWL